MKKLFNIRIKVNIGNRGKYSRPRTLINYDTWLALVQHIKQNKVEQIPDKSRIYFSKSAKFSRVRFREWAKPRGIQISQSPATADIILYDTSEINQCMKTQHEIGYRLMADNTYGIRFKYTASPESYLNSYPSATLLKGVAIEDLTELQKEAGNELVDIASTGKKFISKTQLTKCVLGGYIEEDKFDQLAEMLDSNNQDTVDLGIELLAAYTFEDNPIRMIELLYKRMGIVFDSKVSMKMGFAHLMPYLNKMWHTVKNHSFQESEKNHSTLILLDALGFGNFTTTEMWRDYINESFTLEIGKLFNYDIKLESVNLTIKTDEKSYNININNFHS